jgi:alkylation response protein AidB-like acyl-CoA dehydrogenase
VAQHRLALDAERCLPQPIFEALADAGLLQLWLPKALGGPEVSPEEFLSVVEEAAQLDASVGWIVGVAAGSSLAPGHLTSTTARDLFGSKRAFCAHVVNPSGTARKVAGGCLINGTWSFASGIRHATMVMANCAIAGASVSESPEAKEILSCFLPQDRVSIRDDWHVSGLRGTGSCSFEARDVFVPTDHTLSAFNAEPVHPGLLYRLPKLSLLSLLVAAVPIGIAAGAIQDGCSIAKSRTRTGHTLALCDREIVQDEFGRAKARLSSARAYVREALRELSAAVCGTDDKLIEARLVFKLACVHACQSAVIIVDQMATAVGAIAMFETCPLERRVRDIHAAARHIAVSPSNFGLAGRGMLGVSLGTNRF